MKFRVVWFPQVGHKPFCHRVQSYDDGKALCNALAEYDLFLLEHRHRPDFSNAGAVQFHDQVHTGGEWHDCPEDEADWADELEEMRAKKPTLKRKVGGRVVPRNQSA